jgi:hypothetical protein
VLNTDASSTLKQRPGIVHDLRIDRLVIRGGEWDSDRTAGSP